ncbi:hypothetical protein GQ473_06075 [archaeon]|nr:hypothetical protein [archaeon]
MIERITDLNDKKQTSHGMYNLIELFSGDLKKIYLKRSGRNVPLQDLSLPDFFDLVRKIKYRKDHAPIEVISRPKHILNLQGLGMDCKKKALLIASYLKNAGVPYRLIGSSRKQNGRIHHVFVQGFINNQWENIDATYKHYKLFEKKQVTNAEVL